jgi:proton-dependent oligopeptide transporter, POT family
MLIIAVGSGGIKANVSPLVADQYRQDRPFVKTLSSGERVIVDPNVTIGRIYSLFYWSVNVGSLSSALTTFAEFHVGFWLAFALPTSVFVLTPIILVASNRLYYKIPPRGSIVVEVIHVVRMAFAARRTSPPSKGNFWNRAKPSWYSTRLADLSVEERRRYEHITWDDAFVEEVRRTARACQIALFIPVRVLSLPRGLRVIRLDSYIGCHIIK